MPYVTCLYAGLLGLLSIGLAVPAILLRGQTGISVGDGGNRDLLLAMRRHGNFIEYVPLALILIGLMELSEVRSTVIHGLGAGLLAGRVLHVVGLKAHTVKTFARLLGTALTFFVLLIASIWSIALSF